MTRKKSATPQTDPAAAREALANWIVRARARILDMEGTAHDLHIFVSENPDSEFAKAIHNARDFKRLEEALAEADSALLNIAVIGDDPLPNPLTVANILNTSAKKGGGE